MPYLIIRKFDRRDVVTSEVSEFYKSTGEGRDEYESAKDELSHAKGADDTSEFRQADYWRTTVTNFDGTASVVELNF